jgi:hypothetical protein
MHHNQRHYILSNAICHVTTLFNKLPGAWMPEIGLESVAVAAKQRR